MAKLLTHELSPPCRPLCSAPEQQKWCILILR